MGEERVPEQFSVSLAGMVGLAVEYWRLSAWLARQGNDGAGAGPARHGLRKIQQFLAEQGMEVRGFDGAPYDPGLAVRVIDTVQDAAMAAGEVRIEETLSPMVLWRGRVVREAEVVTRRGKQ